MLEIIFHFVSVKGMLDRLYIRKDGMYVRKGKEDVKEIHKPSRDTSR